MTDKKVWFITGAGREMGLDITEAACAAANIESALATMTLQGDRYPASLQQTISR